MNNLITTIIGIALAIALALAGIFYGGTAYENAQINAIANAIMNEAQQILFAERMWSTNNNQPDISGMGTAGAAGTGMSALVNGKELAEWPSLAGTMGYSASLTNPGPQPYIAQPVSAGTTSTGSYDNGCWNINGYAGKFSRFIFSYNSGNYVAYYFWANTPYTSPCTTHTGSWDSASLSTHPVVLVAKAINSSTGQIPAGVATMAEGIPNVPSYNSNSIFYSSASNLLSLYFNDANYDSVESNFCYTAGAAIVCVFGPS